MSKHIVRKKKTSGDKPEVSLVRETRIHALKAEGKTYSQIAQIMRTTKGVVAGVIYRNAKIYTAKDTTAYGGHRNVISLPVIEAKVKRMPKACKKAEKKFTQTMATGAPGTCQWIEGEASGRNFCGVKTTGVWCDEHHRRVYVPCTQPVYRGKSPLQLKGKTARWRH